MVRLQEPPSSKGCHPCFSDFIYFAPLVARPRVACSVAQNLLRNFTVLPHFPLEIGDFMALYVFTMQGCLSTNSPRFTIGNGCARSLPLLPQSASHQSSLLDLEHPYLVAGDFNIPNAATNPVRLLSSKEGKESAPYFARASDLGFTLLNVTGIYIRFPFLGNHSPSTIELLFANPHMFPAYRSWDASSLPSTGSDHASISVTIRPPLSPQPQTPTSLARGRLARPYK